MATYRRRLVAAAALVAAVVVALVAPAAAEHPRRAAPATTAADMPLPFTRPLQLQSPVLKGDDVWIAQNLLVRSPFVTPHLALSRAYDAATANAVQAFKLGHGLPHTTVFDAVTAELLLRLHLDADGYKDDGQPLPDGYLYKVYVPVYRDRTIETTATLFDAQLNVLRTYTLRTHGQNDPATGRALNQFAPSGVTPTGLATFDLNSPEDDPASFGPYPVNRFVQGLRGNMAVVVSAIRDGLLQHTGEWPGWNASQPMPNSHGCMHGHPTDIDAVWQLLVGLGVAIRNNTNGALPYPYVPQGLVSVELQDP